MNKLLLVLVFMFLLTSISQAEAVNTFNPTSNNTDESLQNTATEDVTEISYGYSNFKFYNTPVQTVQIDRPAKKGELSFSMVGTAEASVIPLLPKDFAKISDTITEASELNGLKSVLSEEYFQLLQEKVDAGVSQYAVLAMFKAMRPYKTYIIDSYTDENHAQLAVSGQSYFGPMQGLINMVSVDGKWKIENESWYAEKNNSKSEKGPITKAISLSNEKRFEEIKRTDLISRISPDYKFKRNSLALIKVGDNRRKQAFNFVFVMDKDKHGDQQSAALKHNSRGRMHVLGPNRLFKEQKVIKNKYPMDVSLSNYNDGYATDEWNLTLPSRKPREVTVSFLWSF